MASRRPVLSPFRHARKAFGLGMVGALAIPLIATNTAVAVTVDGKAVDIRTYATTVGDVLEELGVEVTAADAVDPHPRTLLADGLEIEVDRAVEVDVRVDGEVVDTVHERVGSVAGVLEAADLADVRDRGAVISPGWTAPVEDGGVVSVSLPSEVSLTVDGEAHDVVTHVKTVEELLLEEGISLGEDDVVRPALDERLEDGGEVRVEQVTFEEVVEEVAIERDEERRETDDLEEGDTRVEEEGSDGLRRDTYLLRLVNGEEVDRELVDREVVEEPRTRVVLVGTAVPSTEESGTPGDVWDRLAECESGGNWSHSSGQYHGGLQFHPDTWNRYKPDGYPAYAYEASREQQIAVAERVKASEGWGAWPSCSRKLGLR